MEYKLGQKINVHTKLLRNKGYRVTKREWVNTDIPVTEGIIIGVRTLSDGTVIRDNEEGSYFLPNNFFKALLVVTNIKNKPFFVKVSDYEK